MTDTSAVPEEPPDNSLRQVPPLRHSEAAASNYRKDGKADAEAVLLARGGTEEQIAEEARAAEHARDQKFKDTFESLSIYSLWAMFTGMAILGVVWLLHQVLPERGVQLYCSKQICLSTPARWLIPEQVTVIQDVLTGGLIAGFLVDHFRRRLTR